MIFFIWYSMNIFLTKRKKEIGIYAFMGIENKTISKLYLLENLFLGVSACLVGEGVGSIFSKLFQVLVLKIAGYELNVSYDVTPKALLETFVIFMVIFLIFTLKGMWTISRTQIVDLLNASRQEEGMPKFGILYVVEAIFSVLLLGAGYYLSTIISQNMIYILIVVVFVLVGTYGLYQSLLPLIFKVLSHRKSILYRGENIITISNLTYRMRRNYRTYAMISITFACTVCVLGGAFAMKNSYDEQERQALVYDTTITSEQPIEEAVPDSAYEVKVDLLNIDRDVSSNGILSARDVTLMKYSDLIQTLTVNGYQDAISTLPKELSTSEVIELQRPGTLMSFGKPDTQFDMLGQSYEVVNSTRTIVLGASVNRRILVVSDGVYDSLKDEGEILYFYGVKLRDESQLESVIATLASNLNQETSQIFVGISSLEHVAYLKFVYAVGAFLFLVVMIATGSIIYMKLYQDSSEDKAKYQILLKIGTSKTDLNRAITKEVALFYAIPFIIGGIHSYFGVAALGDFMSMNLTHTFIVALAVCILIFFALGIWSIATFKKVIYR